ncbi:hypothetical protein BDF19DRAFT_457587 [Syncephalis fuscata]|nr:hypothetical protein BDF19DRAFT_457587 [Syncephalis fuscata]
MNESNQNSFPQTYDGYSNVFDYFSAPATGIDEIRGRLFMVYGQFIVNYMVACLFFRNSYLAPMAWCVFFQALVGAVFGVVFTYPFLMPGGPSCRLSMSAAIIAVSMSTFFGNLTLLLKAYAVYDRSRILLTVGILLILPAPPVMTYLITVKSYTFYSIENGCSIKYPLYSPWVKFGLEAPVNVTLSIAFLRIVLQQYKQFGSESWRSLARDGIGTMCLIIGSNLICTLIAALRALGDVSDIFWMVDWVVTSILLVRHIEAMRTSLRMSARPVTDRLMASGTFHSKLEGASRSNVYIE